MHIQKKVYATAVTMLTIARYQVGCMAFGIAVNSVRD